MCYICRGKYREYKNNKCVVCEDCNTLKEFPFIPGLERLRCENCPNLRSIPVIPGLKVLVLARCFALEEIPFIPGLERLECLLCPQFEEIPAISSLQKLNCYMCKNLKNIPFLPNLKELYCSGCVKITELPELSSLDVLHCPPNIKKIPPNNFTFINCYSCPQLICTPETKKIWIDNHTPWVNHQGNTEYKNNIIKLIRLQQVIRKYFLRKGIKNYLQSEAFVAWWYDPTVTGGKKAKQEIEKLLTSQELENNI